MCDEVECFYGFQDGISYKAEDKVENVTFLESYDHSCLRTTGRSQSFFSLKWFMVKNMLRADDPLAGVGRSDSEDRSTGLIMDELIYQ